MLQEKEKMSEVDGHPQQEKSRKRSIDQSSSVIDIKIKGQELFGKGGIKVLKSGCGRRNGGGDAVAVAGCKGRSVTVAAFIGSAPAGGKNSPGKANALPSLFSYQDGVEVFFRIQTNTMLLKVLRAYCQKRKLAYKTVEFLYEGDRFPVKRTPHDAFIGSAPAGGKNSPGKANALPSLFSYQDGIEVFFRIQTNTMLLKVLRAYCQKRNLAYKTVEFLYEGDRFPVKRTPHDYAPTTMISSRKATFYSRSRSKLWTKGETSMNFIDVHDIFLDCDRDSVEGSKMALTTLYSLESTISQRKAELSGPQNEKPSWSKRLLLDDKLLCSKIRYQNIFLYLVGTVKLMCWCCCWCDGGAAAGGVAEEAHELCQTLEESEDKSRTASEMADVLYHAMVLLALRGVKMEKVLQVLRPRFSQSGIEEKKSRRLQQ
ncbi:hypothetical protein TEA_001322 [Camellia sinensis var. sinensis]|uniref:Uncharacterized protein n=1 Tax=Camellia sinensis var. sinensis TaxID=542762 RepID=A0A4S4DE24_CAMSN|nr:hypothetical protein TEA_001322 [Camellia sinensis var. sinensis]